MFDYSIGVSDCNVGSYFDFIFLINQPLPTPKKTYIAKIVKPTPTKHPVKYTIVYSDEDVDLREMEIK